jgi:hypothetical protein
LGSWSWMMTSEGGHALYPPEQSHSRAIGRCAVAAIAIDPLPPEIRGINRDPPKHIRRSTSTRRFVTESCLGAERP